MFHLRWYRYSGSSSIRFVKDVTSRRHWLIIQRQLIWKWCDSFNDIEAEAKTLERCYNPRTISREFLIFDPYSSSFINHDRCKCHFKKCRFNGDLLFRDALNHKAKQIISSNIYYILYLIIISNNVAVNLKQNSANFRVIIWWRVF